MKALDGWIGVGALAVLVAAAVGMEIGFAQDGSTGNVSPDAPSEPAPGAIETGSVFGPITTNVSAFNGDPQAAPALLSTHYDDDPLGGSLNVPPGRTTAITFRRVAAVKGDAMALVLCTVEAGEVWAVEDDPTAELLDRQTTRLYLRDGGYIIAYGPSHGDRGLKARWLEARGLGEMPAVTQPPEKD